MGKESQEMVEYMENEWRMAGIQLDNIKERQRVTALQKRRLYWKLGGEQESRSLGRILETKKSRVEWTGVWKKGIDGVKLTERDDVVREVGEYW